MLSGMGAELQINEAARRLNVSPGYLRLLEKQGRIPPARRDTNGRIYSELDIALLEALGVGSRPRQLRTTAEVLAGPK
jgi:DNA-binding transcriptional MerR regulator